MRKKLFAIALSVCMMFQGISMDAYAQQVETLSPVYADATQAHHKLDEEAMKKYLVNPEQKVPDLSNYSGKIYTGDQGGICIRPLD